MSSTLTVCSVKRQVHLSLTMALYIFEQMNVKSDSSSNFFYDSDKVCFTVVVKV